MFDAAYLKIMGKEYGAVRLCKVDATEMGCRGTCEEDEEDGEQDEQDEKMEMLKEKTAAEDLETEIGLISGRHQSARSSTASSLGRAPGSHSMADEADFGDQAAISELKSQGKWEMFVFSCSPCLYNIDCTRSSLRAARTR